MLHPSAVIYDHGSNPLAHTTMYAGIEFRSRLEARWAAFFGCIGWHYTYEPFEGDGYIPDFLIHGERPLMVEIKPAVTMKDYTAPTAKAENGLREWNSDILILGVDPLPHLGQRANSTGTYPTAGWLGEIIGDGEWEWSQALWMACRSCNAVAVFHSDLTFAGRPCGCYDGDHYLAELNTSWLKEAWAKATNEVKWRGRDARAAATTPAPQRLAKSPDALHILDARPVDALTENDIVIKLPATRCTPPVAAQLRDVLASSPGTCGVLLDLVTPKGHTLLRLDGLKVTDSPPLRADIRTLLGPHAVSTPVTPATSSRKFQLWDKVRHLTFGEGLVLKVENTGDHQVVVVDFGVHHGTKRLLARYAPLDRIGGVSA